MKFSSIILVSIFMVGYGMEVWGQTSTSGMFGSRTVGTSISPGMSSFGGTSSMGGMGMSGMGMGGTGMSGISGMSGMSGMGMSGMSGMGSMGMSGMGNSYGSTQAGEFIGANTGQAGFIGGGQLGQNRGMQSSYQNYGQNSGQYGQFGNTRGANQANRGNQQSNQGSQNSRNQTQLLTTRYADFEYPRSSNTDLSTALSLRLQQTVGKRSPSSIETSFQGNTLVLKGMVATVHDRDLAGILARMEPGIDQVQNDLTVKKAETPDSRDEIPR